MAPQRTAGAWRKGKFFYFGLRVPPHCTPPPGAHRLLCVLNRREFDGPIAHSKNFDESWIKRSLIWGRWPASYKTLTQLSIHLQHSFLQIVPYYVEGAYINRPARSKRGCSFLLPADRIQQPPTRASREERHWLGPAGCSGGWLAGLPGC